MAFTYSGDPGTSKQDWLRFMTGDTNANAPMLQDAELDWIVDQYEAVSDSKMLAVTYRQCANHLATLATKRKLGPQEETTAERLVYFKEYADRLERDLSLTGVPPLPDYQAEKVFEKGMMSNA